MTKKVTMYSTPWCTYCKMTKQFFQDHNISFEEHDVASDAKSRDEMIQKTGQMGVPVIDIDGQIVIGFDQRRLKELFGVL